MMINLSQQWNKYLKIYLLSESAKNLGLNIDVLMYQIPINLEKIWKHY